MKKINILLTAMLLVLMVGCANVNNTPATTNTTTETNYTETSVTNFSGTIESINDNEITLDDGTVIVLGESIISNGNYISMVVIEGPSSNEFIIKEVKYQGTLMSNPGSNTLNVELINGEAEVSGNLSLIDGNIFQILDKRFILNDNTIFNVEVDSGDPLLEILYGEYEVGDYLVGFGVSNEDNKIFGGIIYQMFIS